VNIYLRESRPQKEGKRGCVVVCNATGISLAVHSWEKPEVPFTRISLSAWFMYFSVCKGESIVCLCTYLLTRPVCYYIRLMYSSPTLKLHYITLHTLHRIKERKSNTKPSCNIPYTIRQPFTLFLQLTTFDSAKVHSERGKTLFVMSQKGWGLLLL